MSRKGRKPTMLSEAGMWAALFVVSFALGFAVFVACALGQGVMS